MNKNMKNFNIMTSRWIALICLVITHSFTLVNAQDNPVLQMTSYSSKLLKPDLTPNVSIYADGKIEVYRPIYMKKSGLFVGQLSQSQLNEIYLLIDKLEQFDVIDAEKNYFEADMEIKRTTGQLYYNSETVITQFLINKTAHSSSNGQLVLAESARQKSKRFNHLVNWKMFADAENFMMTLKKDINLLRIGEAK